MTSSSKSKCQSLFQWLVDNFLNVEVSVQIKATRVQFETSCYKLCMLFSLKM